MEQTQHPHSTHMPGGRAQYQTLDAMPFDVVETHILHVARLFFVGFHHPKSQAWMSAIFTAEHLFGTSQGAVTAARILQVVNSARYVRSAGFNYCDPNCVDCARFVTKEERYLIMALHSLRRRKQSDARTQAMLLCQGGDHAPFMGALRLLGENLKLEVSE
jgi:hypothetical protein